MIRIYEGNQKYAHCNFLGEDAYAKIRALHRFLLRIRDALLHHRNLA